MPATMPDGEPGNGCAPGPRSRCSLLAGRKGCSSPTRMIPRGAQLPGRCLPPLRATGRLATPADGAGSCLRSSPASAPGSGRGREMTTGDSLAATSTSLRPRSSCSPCSGSPGGPTRGRTAIGWRDMSPGWSARSPPKTPCSPSTARRLPCWPPSSRTVQHSPSRVYCPGSTAGSPSTATCSAAPIAVSGCSQPRAAGLRRPRSTQPRGKRAGHKVGLPAMTGAGNRGEPRMPSSLAEDGKTAICSGASDRMGSTAPASCASLAAPSSGACRSVRTATASRSPLAKLHPRLRLPLLRLRRLLGRG